MPRYHALDSAIVLSTWDPSIKAVDDPDVVHACKNQTKPSAAQMKALRPISSNLHTDGPSVGYLAQDLKEEYFDGQKGVDFLGDCMPFFLIHAGGDLFGQTQPACDTRLDRRNKTCVPIDQPETPSSSFKANNNVVDTPTRELDTDSILSSISSARFSSVQGSSHGEGTKDSKSDTPGPHPVSQATANLRHIQLLVDLSNKSFMPSLWTGIKQELCITVWYNGELAQSRILKQSILYAANSKWGLEYYGGRRVDTNLESPWAILLPDEMLSNSNDSTPSSSFETRWNAINDLLLTEADEWGRHGKHRSVVGEYLEALSKMPTPTKGWDHDKLSGKAGIIDIVITVGRSVPISAAGLREPHRKLHEDFTGKERKVVVAPEEKRPHKIEQKAINQLVRSQRRSGGRDGGRLSVGVEKKSTVPDTEGSYSDTQSASKPRSTRQSLLGRISNEAFVNSIKSRGVSSANGNGNKAASSIPPHEILDIFTSSPSLDSRKDMSTRKTSAMGMFPPRGRANFPKTIPQKTFKGMDDYPETPERELDSPVSSYSLRSLYKPDSNRAAGLRQRNVTDQVSPAVNMRSTRRVFNISSLDSRSSQKVSSLSDSPDPLMETLHGMLSDAQGGSTANQKHPYLSQELISTTRSLSTPSNPTRNGAGKNDENAGPIKLRVKKTKLNLGPDGLDDFTKTPNESRNVRIVFTTKTEKFSTLVSFEKFTQRVTKINQGGTGDALTTIGEPGSASVRRRPRSKNTSESQDSIEIARPHIRIRDDAQQQASLGMASGNMFSVLSINSIGSMKNLHGTKEGDKISGSTLLPVLSSPLKRTRSNSSLKASILDSAGESEQPLVKKVKITGLSSSKIELGDAIDAHKPSNDGKNTADASSNHSLRSSSGANNSIAPLSRPLSSSVSGVPSTFQAPHINSNINVVIPSSRRKSSTVTTATESKPEETPGDTVETLSISEPIALGTSSENLAAQHTKANNRTSRSYSQSSRGVKKPEPRKDSSTESDTITVVGENTSLIVDLNTAASTFLTTVQLQSLVSPQKKDASVSHVETIAVVASVDVATSSPALAKNNRNKKATSIQSPIGPASTSPSDRWNPNSICQNSVLTYAASVDWPNIVVNKKTGQLVREIKAEREGIFRSTGVLMGVRFVVGV